MRPARRFPSDRAHSPRRPWPAEQFSPRVLLVLAVLTLAPPLAGAQAGRRGDRAAPVEGLALVADKVQGLKREIGALQSEIGGGLAAPVPGAAAARGAQQPPSAPRPCCGERVMTVSAGLASVGADVQRLRAAYRRARHARGLRLAAELDGHVERLGRSLDSLVLASDQRAARAAATHLAAGAEAMLQTIAGGYPCCTIPITPLPASTAPRGTPRKMP